NSAPSDVTLMEDLKLRGWTRACGGTIGPVTNPSVGDCTGADRADWQGFISLGNHGWAGQNAAVPTHQISISDGVFSGYSWDPYVTGWMNWGGNGGNVRFCNVNLPDFAIDATPSIIVTPPDTAIVNKVVVVKITTPSGAQWPAGGVSLGVANPSGVSSSFNGSTSALCASSPCSVNLTVNSAGFPVDSLPPPIIITGTAAGPGGNFTHQATVTINVDVVAGSLSVQCPMPVSHDPLVSAIYYVNRPVVWQVNASGEGGYTLIGGLFFTPSYDGVAGAEQPSGTFTRSYSTLGRKSFSASVRDENIPPAEGECGPVEIVIGVDPRIIEL
ncbi:MAG: hypothetical protein AAB726_01920, partial [Patescibacteria group bacterium]